MIFIFPFDNDIVAIFWTSGTTGDPKGIPYHHKFICSTELFTKVLDDKLPSLITTYMFHVVGIIRKYELRESILFAVIEELPGN